MYIIISFSSATVIDLLLNAVASKKQHEADSY